MADHFSNIYFTKLTTVEASDDTDSQTDEMEYLSQAFNVLSWERRTEAARKVLYRSRNTESQEISDKYLARFQQIITLAEQQRSSLGGRCPPKIHQAVDTILSLSRTHDTAT